MRLLALGLGLALALAACSAGSRSPEGAVRAFAEMAADGDRGSVWWLLGPVTRAKLTEEARRATALSGRRPLEPEELLAVGWFAPHWRPVEVRERSRDGDRATVEVRGAKGESETVHCVRVDGAWKVELE